MLDSDSAFLFAICAIGSQRLHLDVSEGKWLPIAQLYNAAKFGDVDDMRQFLAEGVNPDLKSPRNITPLMVAAFHGHIKSVKLLLDLQVVDVNVRSISGRSPIFDAAAGSFENIVGLLLSRGANPDFRDEDGQTPLSIATHNRRNNVRLWTC